jgi:tRNA G18 (ribose-2'-O)-methylase SpoU
MIADPASASGSSEIVDSLLHPLAALIRKVLTRQGRQELDLILIDDEENIAQALNAGVHFHSVYFAGDERLSDELARRLPPSVPVHEVARRTCKKLFEKDRFSRLFAIAHTPAVRSLRDLLEVRGDIVALEDLTISGNIGSIVRSSVAFGIGGIVLLNAEPVDVHDRRIIRSSRGHIFSLPIATATTEELIDFCKDNDLPMLVMAAGTGRWIRDAAAQSQRMVIVLGSEKDGCSPQVMDAATVHVQIPIDPRVESLNVSTAAAIMLYSRLWFNLPEMGQVSGS